MPLLDHADDPAAARSRAGDVPAALRAQAPPATASVVIVDPHPPLRDGLALLLRPEGIDVLAGASTGAAGETLIVRHEPDVALISADLADVDAVVLLRRLVGRGLRSAVVLYASDEADQAQATLALHAGAAGIVAKRRTLRELAIALRAVASGAMWFGDGGDAPAPAPAAQRALPASRRTDALSSAELRVLALVADGESTEAAAEALSLSPHTVRTHLRNVMRKLEASSRAHAVAIAIREAAIEL